MKLSCIGLAAVLVLTTVAVSATRRSSGGRRTATSTPRPDVFYRRSTDNGASWSTVVP